MSEYWVSHKKYFCKYCNIYIADDAPSRSQHEGGLRHKGNVERFVRGLYKSGEKRKQDLEEEKMEMRRVEQAAQAAYARDVGAGLIKADSSTAPKKPSAPSTPAPRPSNPYENYSTAESLGFTDPDAERLQAEAELRRTQGLAGEWEVVTASEPAQPTGVSPAKPARATPELESSKKRVAEAQIDDEDTREFRLRRKTWGASLGDIYDPGLIPIKLKPKESPADGRAGSETQTDGQPIASGSNAPDISKPKWSARGWNRPSAATSSESQAPEETPTVSETAQPVKTEEPEPAVKPEPEDRALEQEVLADARKTLTAVKEEPGTVKFEEEATAPAPAGSLFRKRKVPAGGAGSRGRRS